MCSKYSRKNKKTKVGKKEVSIPAEPQPVIRPTDRASILRASSSGLEPDRTEPRCHDQQGG
ncbi:MAG: hypothetical protein EB079_06615 [Verrucomicrobia bacterium]|nr:hypothetical protein [Verrucomicrobiota bacterium]